jgi:hypothetical protein
VPLFAITYNVAGAFLRAFGLSACARVKHFTALSVIVK